MTPSPRIVTFIQGFESCAESVGDGTFRAYMPTPNDRPTIGWGSTGDDITLGLIWTQAQCDERFAADLADFATGVNDALAVDTSQDQFDAMVSLAYNIGRRNFDASTLLRLHNAGDFAGAAAQFPRWCKQSGITLAGLVRRRAGEAAIYQGATQ